LKRALILFGAGASIDYGAPSTNGLTSTIEQKLLADTWVKNTGGDVAYKKIKSALTGYLSSTSAVNFEQIYHCSHELLTTFYTSTPGAADEFKPILVPFLVDRIGFNRDALQALCDKLVDIIFHDVSNCCEAPSLDFRSLSAFLKKIRANYVTRIYTTNYDDFPLQAAPDLYNGFADSGSGPARFDVDGFWRKERRDGIFHLHGSVHMGFLSPPVDDVGELAWFNDRAEAQRHSSFSGSSPERMDGTSVLRTAVITGLEKLSRVQQRPFAHFYSMMARDSMRADIIFVIGSGLADLHLNTCLAEARSRSTRPPLLYVDWWPNSFEEDVYDDTDSKSVRLFHKLKVHISREHRGTRDGGWLISQDRSAAIWDKGFASFLKEDLQLDRIHSNLMGVNAPSLLDRAIRSFYRRISR
jgi:hypothetical protein